MSVALPESVHSQPVDEVVSSLEVDPERGLGSDEAGKRLEELGRNKLPEAPKPNVVLRFLSHFNDVLIYVLLGAAVITAVMGHWVDTAVIALVAVVNATIGFVQEGRAEKALDGLSDMLSPEATVRRDGSWTEIDAEEVVPGDVVRLRSGDQVPADVRLVEASSLRVEESALTGESEAVAKSTEEVDDDADLGDRTSMAFSSSMISGGQGVGVVTATGQHTEIGKISGMLSEVETLETPLTKQMNKFGKWLTGIILVAAVLLFLAGRFLHGSDLEALFQATIGFAVGAVPEGLPAILSITLARGVQRMAGRNAITRKLNSIETLGSVSVICSDKTGTLTKNEMTVRCVATPGQRYEVEGQGYAPEGSITDDDGEVGLDEHADLRAVVETMAVANEAELTEDDGEWTLVGEPTDGALITLAKKASFVTSGYERSDEIPFNSDNKFMAVVAGNGDGTKCVHLKGAPGRVLELCSTQGTLEDNEELDRDMWEELIDELSDEGLRVLAAAVREGDSLDGDDPGDGFTLVGMVGIVDPPRPEAIESIEDCRRAGIRVKMITGDHIGTAEAIGRELGLGDGEELRSITGSELENASDEELEEIAQTHDVFARTSPEHKLRLVKALQERGEVVAMTGDGVNDAPALRRADVGVAMGIKGTEVTKEAAEVVLADDNFTSIEQAVEEGRTIYDNLRKSILFILPTNGAESLVIIAAVLAGFTLPLSPLQILWVNMVIAVTLAIALAFEPAEPGVMDRRPRSRDSSILDKQFLWRVILVSLLVGGATLAVFLTMYDGDNLALARTMTVNVLVLAQAFYLFNVRVLNGPVLRPSVLFSNWVAWASVGALVLLQLLFSYAPFMNAVFGSAPLGWEHWAISIGVGVGVLLIVEAEKLVMRRVRS